MRVGVLFSGGKDSTYSAYIASQKDTLTCLVTIRPQRDDSYMFHFPNLNWTGLQAGAMGLPQVNFDTPGEKELELDDLRSALGAAKEDFFIEGVYTGALASVYQKTRVERICNELDLECISPIWGADPSIYLTSLLESQFSVMITAVAAMGLDESWLGRKLDAKVVEELTILHERFGLNAALEGGEGETFVLDCPLFNQRIEIISSEKHWNGMNGYLEFLEARLVDKQ